MEAKFAVKTLWCMPKIPGGLNYVCSCSLTRGPAVVGYNIKARLAIVNSLTTCKGTNLINSGPVCVAPYRSKDKMEMVKPHIMFTQQMALLRITNFKFRTSPPCNWLCLHWTDMCDTCGHDEATLLGPRQHCIRFCTLFLPTYTHSTEGGSWRKQKLSWIMRKVTCRQWRRHLHGAIGAACCNSP